MYKKILVVVDEREVTRSAIHQSSEAASRALAAASALAERYGIHNHRAMGQGEDEAHCVAEAASKRHCDLIVVGTEERNAVMRLLSGSIVPGLISAAKVPILICRELQVRPKLGNLDPLSKNELTGPLMGETEERPDVED